MTMTREEIIEKALQVLNTVIDESPNVSRNDEINKYMKDMSSVLSKISEFMEAIDTASESSLEAIDAAVHAASDNPKNGFNKQAIENVIPVIGCNNGGEPAKFFEMVVPDYRIQTSQARIYDRVNTSINAIKSALADDIMTKLSVTPAYRLAKNLLNQVLEMFSVDDISEITDAMIEIEFKISNTFSMYNDSKLFKLESIGNQFANKFFEFRSFPEIFYTSEKTKSEDTPSEEVATWTIPQEESPDDKTENTSVVEETPVVEEPEVEVARVLSAADAAKFKIIEASIDDAKKIYNDGLGSMEALQVVFDMEKMLKDGVEPNSVAIFYDATYADAFNQFAVQGKIDKLAETYAAL